MKKNLTILKTVFLFLLLIIVYSCRTDNALNSNEEILQRKKFYYISKNEITNKSITKKIEDLQANSIVKRTSKKTMLDGIKINEDKVLVFEDKEGNKTYTFSVTREDKTLLSPIENIVIYKLKDGTNKAFLVKYNITKPEKEDFLLGKNKEILSKTEIFNIDNSDLPKNLTARGSGQYNSSITYYDAGCVRVTYESYTADCTCEEEDNWSSIEIEYLCGSNGGGGSGSGGGTSGGSGSYGDSGGGGSSGGTTFPYEEPADGFDDDYNYTVTDFRNLLSGNQLTWFDSYGNKELSYLLATAYNLEKNDYNFNHFSSYINTALANNNSTESRFFAFSALNYYNLNGYNHLNYSIVNQLIGLINNEKISLSTAITILKDASMPKWTVDFFIQNPNTSIEQFKKWFIDGNQEFNRELLKIVSENNYKIPSYTISDYPGKNNGMPFNWWNDETYLNTNMSLGFNSLDLTLEEIKMCALFPAAALTISTNKSLALDTAANSFPGQGAHNNKADAFRHAFFNALNIRDVYSQPSTLGMFTFAKDIVRMFGIAHESEVPADLYLEKVMDLYNNEQGIEVCSTCNPLTNPTNLVKGYVMSLLENGKLRHIWPLNIDQTIRPDSNLYPTNQH